MERPNEDLNLLDSGPADDDGLMVETTAVGPGISGPVGGHSVPPEFVEIAAPPPSVEAEEEEGMEEGPPVLTPSVGVPTLRRRRTLPQVEILIFFFKI